MSLASPLSLLTRAVNLLLPARAAVKRIEKAQLRRQLQDPGPGAVQPGWLPVAPQPVRGSDFRPPQPPAAPRCGPAAHDTPQKLSTHFPLTHFGSDVNGKCRSASRWVHGRSAILAAHTALASPSLHRVRQNNLAQLARVQAGPSAPTAASARDDALARLTPALLDAIRDQILEHLDDAFLTNLRRHLYKAGDLLVRELKPDDPADPAGITRTRASLVAEMFALDDPQSAFNQALQRLAPALAGRGPIDAMHPLERADLVLKLAAETIDCVMRPTPEQARRTARLLVELGEQGQCTFDRIHTESLRSLQHALSRLPPGTSQEWACAVAARQAAETTERINRARKELFDTFRRRNGGEFGYHSLSEQVRENANIEYYRSLLLPGAQWGAVSRLVSGALVTIVGPVGLALATTATAVSMYVTAVTSQLSVGPTGAAGQDTRHFDSAAMPKPAFDPEVYANQRELADTVQQIAQRALQAYTRPGNPGAQACRLNVQRLEYKGYDQAARDALALPLYALCDYHDHMLGSDSAGLDQAVPPPIRIAALLQTFAAELPSLCPLRAGSAPPDEAACRTVVQSLIEAINRRSDRTPPADAATIAARTRAYVEALQQRSGMDRAALAAALSPDAVALHAGGVDFVALIRTLLQSCGMLEQSLFQSRGALSAQYRGLLVNAAVGLALQIAIGLAAFFGISAASAAGTPAAGFGATVAFTALSLAASALSRDRGAVTWYRHDIRSQGDAQLYRLMRLPGAAPVAGDPAEYLAMVEKAVQDNHSPLYEKRYTQLFHSLRAAWEMELIRGSHEQAEQGWRLLALLEPLDPASRADPAGGFAAELAGRSMEAMHRAGTVAKHQSFIDTHALGRTLVGSAAASAEAVLGAPDAHIQAAADAYIHEEKRYGLRQSYGYRDRHPDYFQDADGTIPAQVELDALRLRARGCFERHLEHQRGMAGLRLFRGDFEALKTCLRVPRSDEATELWIAGLQRRLEVAGELVDQPVDLPLRGTRLPLARVRAWRGVHRACAARIEEHQRAMRLVVKDMLALKSGRFAEVQDPLGVIAASLAHDGLAGQISRVYRTNDDIYYIAFIRGTARFAGQVIPVTLHGAATSVLMLAGGVIAILQASGPHIGEFRIGKLSPDEVHELVAQGIQPSKLQLTGALPRFGNITTPFAAGGMNGIQPEGNPITFQKSQQAATFTGAFLNGDASFTSLIQGSAADLGGFAGALDRWSGEPAPTDGVLVFLATHAGSTQNKLRVNLRLSPLPDIRHLARHDRFRWDQARRQSTQAWNARLGGFGPSRFLRDLGYARNARHHFKQVQADRHGLATSLTVAGHRLASLGAPADPLVHSDMQPELVAFTDAMLLRLLQEPGIAARLFVGAVPPGLAAQHQVILRAACANPWYLLRLVDFYRDRLDPQAAGGEGPLRRQLDDFHRVLTHDVLRATLPVVEQQLRHAIALCAEQPMPSGRLAELQELLARTTGDVARMGDGSARRGLQALLGDLAGAVANLREVTF